MNLNAEAAGVGPCTRCRGQGYVIRYATASCPHDQPVRCPACGGDGVRITHGTVQKVVDGRTEPCDTTRDGAATPDRRT